MWCFLSRRLGIEVKDFGPSWRSGVAFHSVILAIRPDLVDMDIVRKRSNRENLEEAFSVAENELGIPRLLDPEGTDMTTFLQNLSNLPWMSTQNSTMVFWHGNTMFCRHVQCNYFKWPWVTMQIPWYINMGIIECTITKTKTVKSFMLLEKMLTEK